MNNKTDLNLLRILDALLQEGSVTRAAARVHLAQPTVSNALARLRAVFGDPLLARRGKHMRPTARAQQLMAPSLLRYLSYGTSGPMPTRRRCGFGAPCRK